MRVRSARVNALRSIRGYAVLDSGGHDVVAVLRVDRDHALALLVAGDESRRVHLNVGVAPTKP